MSGFLKRLGAIFSGNDNDDSGAEAKPSATKEYEGYLIASTPMKEGGQFRLCGIITKEIDGEVKEHTYIRADLFQSMDDADEFALRKGQQMIDQLGDRIFD